MLLHVKRNSAWHIVSSQQLLSAVVVIINVICECLSYKFQTVLVN